MPVEGQALACSGQGPEGCQGTCFFLEREQEVICLQRHLLPRSGPCSEAATPFHSLGSPQVSHELGRTVSCHKWPNATGPALGWLICCGIGRQSRESFSLLKNPDPSGSLEKATF